MEKSARLRLLYLGNLGLAHDVPLLIQLLRRCRQYGEVSLTFYGTGEPAVNRIRRMLDGQAVPIEVRPHLAFSRLRETLAPLTFDFGLVTLAEEFAGLLSPSKFAGYLAAGVPTLYLGPAETNTALVCDRFGAGIRLDRDQLASSNADSLITDLFNPARVAHCRAGLAEASAYFGQFDGDYLAREILARAKAG